MDSYNFADFFNCPPGSGDDCLNEGLLDSLLNFPPPPPLPSFWNISSQAEACPSSLCHVFAPETGKPEDYRTNNPNSDDSVVPVACAVILGLTLGALLLIFVWYRKSKNSPTLPPSLPSSSETEYMHSCPVVNGKSPHSVIISHRGTISYSNMPVTSTLSGGNPWGRTTGFTIDYSSRGLIPGSSVLHSEENQYAMRESCTSSPVYAELDGGNNSISPYAVGMAEHIPEDPYLLRQANNRSRYYYTTQRANF